MYIYNNKLFKVFKQYGMSILVLCCSHMSILVFCCSRMSILVLFLVVCIACVWPQFLKFCPCTAVGRPLTPVCVLSLASVPSPLRQVLSGRGSQQRRSESNLAITLISIIFMHLLCNALRVYLGIMVVLLVGNS